MPQINVGGATLALPDGASPEAIQTAIKDFQASPDFDHLIDKGTGAPTRVRMIVDGAPPQDRLANLRKFYPDAINYDDNFVFTDPSTGRPTLYNPKGADLGDLAGATRIGAQVLGSAVGATVGAPAGPAGAIGGAALGSAAGGQLYDLATRFLEGAVDTRTIGQKTADIGLDALTGGGGEAAGMALSAGAKAFLGGGRRAVQATADAFRSIGVQPPAAAISGGRMLGMGEKALGNVPSSSRLIQKQTEEVLKGVTAAADDVAKQLGTPMTTQNAGEVIQGAAKAAAERFNATAERVYDKAYALVGADTPVALPNVTALRDQMASELAKAPKSLSDVLKPMIGRLDSLIDDAGSSGIPFDALRQVRTNLGRDIKAPLLSGSTGSQQEALKRIYGALAQDMSAAAQTVGPEAAQALKVADRHTRMWMNTAADTMQKIANFDAPEGAFKYAMSQAPDGGSRLMLLRRRFTPEQWDTVAASAFARLGRATPGAQDATGEVFSPATFLTNWSKMSAEAKGALFGGTRYAEVAPKIDALTKVVASLKAVNRLENTSNTASHLMFNQTLQALAGAGLATVSGQGQTAAITYAAGSVVAPYFAAKLLTSPRFVAWLAEPAASATGVSAHIGRLAAIAEAEPELRQALSAYAQALRGR